MKIGDKIHVEACKADGHCYRAWDTTIVELSDTRLVTASPAGQLITDAKRGNWVGQHMLRTYYWFDKPYNLIEVFETDGRLLEIYINVASPPWFRDGVLGYTDYELDVSAYPPAPAVITDADEFAAAALQYGYTQEFQHAMQRIAEQALEIANTWPAQAAPIFGEDHAQ
jgi:protein associated with RNAse G/E